MVFTGDLFTLKSFEAGASTIMSAYFGGNFARFVSLTELSSNRSWRLAANSCSKFTSFSGGDSLNFREFVGNLFTVTRPAEVGLAVALSSDARLPRLSLGFPFNSYLPPLLIIGNFWMRASRT